MTEHRFLPEATVFLVDLNGTLSQIDFVRIDRDNFWLHPTVLQAKFLFLRDGLCVLQILFPILDFQLQLAVISKE